jgi:hypothetical protein
MKTIGALIGLAVLVLMSGCGNGETVAVLDIEDSGAQLSEAVLEQLADHLAGKIGEGGDLHVLPRTTDTAQTDVDYVLAPRILRPGDRCSLVLRLYRYEGRATVRSTSVQTNCDADGLLDAIDVAVFRLGSLETIPPRVEPPKIVLEKQPVRIAEKPEAQELAPAPIAPPPGGSQPSSQSEGEPKSPPKKTAAIKPATKAPVEAPKEPSPGFLSVSTRPWSEVHIDGKKVGYSPVVRLKLPAGKHALTLLSADGLRRDIPLEIQPGKVSKVIHKFKRGSDTSNGIDVEQQYGTLLVNSNPWSRVTIDGQSVGITPLLDVKLPVGPHTVVLETAKGVKKEFAVIIEAGTKRKIIADLTEKPRQVEKPPLESPPEPDTGFISVNTRPWSKVAVNGKLIGTTPLANHELPPGKYLVSLEGSEGQRVAGRQG